MMLRKVVELTPEEDIPLELLVALVIESAFRFTWEKLRMEMIMGSGSQIGIRERMGNGMKKDSRKEDHENCNQIVKRKERKCGFVFSDVKEKREENGLKEAAKDKDAKRRRWFCSIYLTPCSFLSTCTDFLLAVRFITTVRKLGDGSGCGRGSRSGDEFTEAVAEVVSKLPRFPWEAMVEMEVTVLFKERAFVWFVWKVVPKEEESTAEEEEEVFTHRTMPSPSHGFSTRSRARKRER